MPTKQKRYNIYSSCNRLPQFHWSSYLWSCIVSGHFLEREWWPIWEWSFPGDFINMQKCSFGKNTKMESAESRVGLINFGVKINSVMKKIGTSTNSIENFSTALLGVANETIPKTSNQWVHKRSAPWFNDSCKMAVAERKKSTCIHQEPHQLQS